MNSLKAQGGFHQWISLSWIVNLPQVVGTRWSRPAASGQRSGSEYMEESEQDYSESDYWFHRGKGKGGPHYWRPEYDYEYEWYHGKGPRRVPENYRQDFAVYDRRYYYGKGEKGAKGDTEWQDMEQRGMQVSYIN